MRFRTVPFLFGERHRLFFFIQFRFIFFRTGVGLNGLILDLAALGPIVNDVPGSFGKLRIVLIRRRIFFLVFVAGHLNKEAHGLAMAKDVALCSIELVCPFASRVVRSIRHSYAKFATLNSSCHVVLPHVGVCAFHTVRGGPCTYTKRSLSSG